MMTFTSPRLRGEVIRYRPPIGRKFSASLSLNPALDQNPLRAVVPDVHLHDLAILHHKAIDIAVALERRAVDPFAVERADAVDHGLPIAGADIEAVHLLFDPAI